jgi:hypothetical protein
MNGLLNEGPEIAYQSQSGIVLFLFILFLAISFAISNSFIALIFVGLYNFIANILGGIRVEMLANQEDNDQHILEKVDQEFIE